MELIQTSDEAAPSVCNHDAMRTSWIRRLW